LCFTEIQDESIYAIYDIVQFMNHAHLHSDLS